MPASAIPRLLPLFDGQDFDSEENLRVLNRNVLVIRDKFGALVANDLSGGELDVRGPIDMLSHSVDGASEAMRVVNIAESGMTLTALMANMTTGGVIFIPGGWSAEITSPIVMKSNVEIVGAGVGSNIYCLVDNVNLVSVGPGVKNWGIRNLRMSGQRTVLTAGCAILVSGADETQGVIENVVIGGPRIDSEITNSFQDDGIRLRDSSDVRISGCRIRNVELSGIYADGCTRIGLFENRIQRSGRRNVIMVSSSDLILCDNTLERAGWDNLYMLSNKRAIVFGNQAINASFAAPNTYHNYSMSLTSDLVFVENQGLDDNREGLRSTKYQIFSALTARGVVVSNWMNETSFMFGGALGLAMLVASASGFGLAKDNNHVFGTSNLRSLRRGLGGWNPLGGDSGTTVLSAAERAKQYNYLTDNSALAVKPDPPSDHSKAFSPQIPLIGSQPGLPLGKCNDYYGTGLSSSRGNLGANNTYFSDGGIDATAAYRLGLNEFLDRLCKPRGNVMTPAVIESGHSDLENEVGAIHATFCIYERPAGSNPEDPSGILESWGDGANAGNLSYGVRPRNRWLPFWGPTTLYHGGSGACLDEVEEAGMYANVLCAYITSIPRYPYDAGRTAPRGDKFVVVMSGATGLHRDQRPTWVSVHI